MTRTRRVGRPRLGWDLRTRKRVIIVGEALGVKLFAGNINRPPSPAKRRKMAKDLTGVCVRHGIMPQRLALDLVGLGHEMLLGLARR